MKILNVLTVLVMVMISALGLTSPLQAAWVGNDGGGGAGGGGDGENSTQIEGFIIDGASNYLQSYSDLLLLLNESEMGLKNGFNFKPAHLLVESALDKLMLSSENYSMALAKIKITVFDEVWLKALKTFDYERLTAVRHLHPEVMKQVAAFLSNGDVAGLYQQMVDNLKDIITNLQSLAERTREGILPEMEALRTLYQQYADFMTFGYYASLVFSAIKSS